MEVNELVEQWLSSDVVDSSVKDDIRNMDEKSLQDAFYKNLEFGTGGMRGVIGAGINRMNIYTVRRVSQGLYLAMDEDCRRRGVAIAYDTRNFSAVFAREAARVLVANGSPVYLFEGERSTPELSFAVRHIGTGAGIVITASHNPKEYNGYKAYGADGGQFPPKKADIISDAVYRLDLFKDIKLISDEELDRNPLLHIIGKEVDDAFLAAVKTQQIAPEVIVSQQDKLKLVYTPFHGTGKMPVTRILEEIGVKHVYMVPEQAVADGNFPTVKFPNPEFRESFEMAIDLAKKKDVDLIIGTDPDCDRVGVVVRDKSGEYRVLTGNQTGALLCEYILNAKKRKGTLQDNSTVVKSIVSTPMADAIAKSFGVRVINVLTGFKYIGEVMSRFEQDHSGTYELGFEESYGYLVGTHARDKDAVVATMLIVEMAAFYKTKDMSLYEGLQELFSRYGNYREKTISVTMPGKDGMEKIVQTMDDIRKNGVKGVEVKRITDFGAQTMTENGKTQPFTEYDKSNVIRYELSDNVSWFVARPSGTEPKIKFYFGTMAPTKDQAEEKLQSLMDIILKQVEE